MNEDQRKALHEQYECPDISITSIHPEVLSYINRLEQGIVDLAHVRDVYADAAWKFGGVLSLLHRIEPNLPTERRDYELPGDGLKLSMIAELVRSALAE